MSFTVYKSSAGSGKTFTLVKEYLCLVLPEPGRFRHILAITFTNKAAGEMKERVLKNLAELSRPDEERDPSVSRHLLPMLMTDTGLSEEEIRIRAGQALKLILHNYSDFAIGTIDSFSHRIIRTFAHDFGLPVSFDIGLDSRELIETAVSLLLDRAGEDEELTRLLVRFLTAKMDEERSSDIAAILNEFAKVLLDEAGIMHLEKLKGLTLSDFTRITETVYKKINTFVQAITELAKEAVSLIRAQGISPGAFYQGERGIGGYFDKLARGDMDRLKSEGYAGKTVIEGKWLSGSASAGDAEKIMAIRERLAGLYARVMEAKEEHYGDYVFLKLLAKTIYPLAVLHEIEKTLDEFKKQNELVHISEFNRKIASIVLSEPVPFIYERLGERYNHLLIDEFQDTSRLQWSNLLPLVDNALASGSFNLVVGDGKQAIYRWRNGDVEQFAGLPAIPGSAENPLLREREDTLTRNYRSFPLKKNFRSAPAVIDFNNRFFSYLTGKYPGEIEAIYGDPSQEMNETKSGGYVNIEFVSPKDDDSTYRETTLDKVLDRIVELQKDGFGLRDIAILCRKKRDGNEIARFLTGHGVKVVSSEALLLASSPEVRFITGVMRILSDPYDPVLAGELLATLFTEGRIAASSLHELLMKIDKYRPAESFFAVVETQYPGFLASRLRELPLFELAEELARCFFPDRSGDPYILFFLEKSFGWSGKNTSGTTDFLEWWDVHVNELSVIMPEGLNAVRIMTIHKAKGLEFPAVIIPFAHDKKEFARNWLWIDAEDGLVPGLPTAMLKAEKDVLETRFHASYEEESRKALVDLANLLYVAMTRAEERLYILSKPAPEKSSDVQSVPVFLCDFLKSTDRWDDDVQEYSFGTPGKYSPHRKADTSGTVGLGLFAFGNRKEKIRIRRRAPEVWDLDDPKQYSRWGNLVHLALSMIRTAEDISPVVEDLAASGILEDGESTKLAAALHDVAEGEATARFFEKGLQIRTEAEILLKTGKSIRPDRVVMLGDVPALIDYKTGKPSPSHEEQIRNYAEVLTGMGYKNIRKFLLYLSPEIKLIEISDVQ